MHTLTDSSMAPQLSGEEWNPTIIHHMVTKYHMAAHTILKWLYYTTNRLKPFIYSSNQLFLYTHATATFIKRPSCYLSTTNLNDS